MSYFLLNIYCNCCDSSFSYTLDENEEKEIRCPTCDSQIISFKKYTGYIYILSNESFKNVLKIGCTERPVSERINELSKSTSIPTPFILEAYFNSQNHYVDESNIHKELSEYRINNGREFFKIEIFEAVEIISEIIGSCPFFIGEQLSTHYRKRDAERLENERIKNEEVKTSNIKEIYYCNKCGKFINPPSPNVLSAYALFWRDKCCPVCETKLLVTKK